MVGIQIPTVLDYSGIQMVETVVSIGSFTEAVPVRE